MNTPLKEAFAPAFEDLETRMMLEGIEEKVLTNYTLADAMREGAQATTPVVGWGGGIHACAFSAAAIAAAARGYLRP